jgi:hypothetical protein
MCYKANWSNDNYRQKAPQDEHAARIFRKSILTRPSKDNKESNPPLLRPDARTRYLVPPECRTVYITRLWASRPSARGEAPLVVMVDH